MSVLSRRPGHGSFVSRWVTPLCTLAVLGYFGFHAFSGQYGIRAHLAFSAKETALQAELAELTNRRGRLEARVLLLRDGTMERDMLDERARRTLNVVRADEIAIAFE